MQQEHLTKEIKKNVLKEIIHKLHNGQPVEDIKKEFRSILSHVTTNEITELEEELINEGMSREEILKLCEIHMQLFKEAIEGQFTLAPIGHPIYILMREHKLMLDLVNNLIELVKNEQSIPLETLSSMINNLKSTECHYLREENVLFPYLEKHGVTEPPKIMWMEHDNIREVKKLIYLDFEMLNGDNSSKTIKSLKNNLNQLLELLSRHFYKENNILFSVAMRLIEKDEWLTIYKEFVEIGFTNFYTPEIWSEFILSKSSNLNVAADKDVVFETGHFNLNELQSLLNTLPFDITFVDSNDVVRYFSDSKDRIFVRTKAIIGRKVQQCHPEKSVHIVNKILEDFKSKAKDVESFWINLHGKLIFIQYFAVRDKENKYLGCLEVTRDITELKDLKGEKRLL